jgi:hypothetical protein
MTRLPESFIEDRALRDAARAVLEEDLTRLRATLEEEGIASRVTSSVGSTISGRIRAGASDILDRARTEASDHKGVLALLLGALILWFTRGPILALFAEDNEAEDTEAAPSPDPTPDGDPA